MISLFFLGFFYLQLASSSFNKEEQKSLVDTHNEVRARAMATGMVELQWDKKLVEKAQEMADKEREPFSKDVHAWNYIKTINSDKMEPRKMVSWWLGSDDYNFMKKKCIREDRCFYYLNLMKDTASKMGCAQKDCGMGEKVAYCVYNQGAEKSSYEFFEVVRRPFVHGERLSDCPVGTKPGDKLGRRTLVGSEASAFMDKMAGKKPEVPYESDIVIVGGGMVGMMCAYFLKSLSPLAYAVTVVEKDPLLKHSATSLFYEGLKQQYAREDFIKMAAFSASFLRQSTQLLSIPDLQKPDILFTPQGCMLLAEDDEEAATLKRNVALQNSMGVDVEVMGATELRGMYSWMNPSNITLASLGYSNEGWYDVGLLMGALKGKAASLGVSFINGEVVGFGKESQKIYCRLSDRIEKRSILRSVQVELTSTKQTHPLKFSRCLLTAGPNSASVAELAGIGVNNDTYTPLPIVPRRKHVYLVESVDGPGVDMPMMQHKSFFIRRLNHLSHYIITSLQPLDDSNEDSLIHFQQRIQPILCNLIPAFKSMQLLQHWSGHSDHNSFDCGLLLSNHPYHLNLFLTAGDPAMGLAPAVGRTMMEMILKDRVELVDTSKMTFDRVMYDEKEEEEKEEKAV